MDRWGQADLVESVGRLPFAGGEAEGAVVGQQPDELLEEQRVAASRLGQAGPQFRIDDPWMQQVVDQLLGLRHGKRRQQDRDRVRSAPRPITPPLEQLRPGQAEEQDGSTVRPLAHVLEEVEQRRLSPVKVVHHQHQRCSAARSSSIRRRAQ
jgi:hypothetical protein